MRPRSSLLAVGLLLAIVLPALGAFPKLATAEWQSYGRSDGLPDAHVVYEDHAENIWVLSSGVVSRYDGLSWRTFSSADGLLGLTGNAILGDRSGAVWVATDEGVARYDGSQWRTFTTADGLGAPRPRVILQDRAGALWFGTDGGVSRYDGTSWETFTTVDGLADDRVFAILEDRAGVLWFGGEGTVTRYDGTIWTAYRQADGVPSDKVVAMIEDASGAIWVGTDGTGAARYDGTTWTTFTRANGLGDNYVGDIDADTTGALWFATRGGASRFDGTGWRTFTTADGLADDDVREIVVDRDGRLWFATFGGASRFDGSRWRSYKVADGLAGNQLFSLIQDRSGAMWFACGDAGLSRFDRTEWKSFTTANGLASDRVSKIFEDRSGALWFPTENDGLTRFDGQSWRTFTPADGLGSFGVNAVFQARDGTLWAAGYRVQRFDGTSWSNPPDYPWSQLPSDQVKTIFQDRSGAMWFGTQSGAVRFDGTAWTVFPEAGSLPEIVEDRAGVMWFGSSGSDAAALRRYDGSSWTTFTAKDGLPSNWITKLLVDRSGSLWVGTTAGISRYDGAQWRNFPLTTYDGSVTSIMEDRLGNIWFGTSDGAAGVGRYDGTSLRRFTSADGLGGDDVYDILEDRTGALWFAVQAGFASPAGVSRLDGQGWGTYNSTHGLVSGLARAILETQAGSLWFGTEFGASWHEPDRVPPQTVISPKPPAISASTVQSLGFAAGFRESRGVRFSYSFDGSPWSAWSATNSWSENNLSDGTHVFQVRARDEIGNVDPSPATCVFEVDATPPSPILISPVFGQAVRDTVVVRGIADDPRFRRYTVEVRPVGTSSWAQLVDESTRPQDERLAVWNSRGTPDGLYELRVIVQDTLELTGSALVRVEVDNELPAADQTAPARIGAIAGGDVYTARGEGHLYFPPRAFQEDAIVDMRALTGLLPEPLPGGTQPIATAYEVDWGGVSLVKPATLDFAYDPALVPAGWVPTLYTMGADSLWRRIGGTPDAVSHHVAAPLTAAASIALFAEEPGATSSGGVALSGLSLTPRVFSPAGTVGNATVGISFSLGRSAPVTVRVHNRAGRIIREVLAGTTLTAGANLVRWDGRNESGQVAADGIYLITVEALGETRTLPVGLMR